MASRIGRVTLVSQFEVTPLMCGILGYIGPQKVVPVVIEGLRKLEYRGYDSAGIAVVNGTGKLEIRRAPGKLRNLEEAIAKSPLEGTYGIGHTRWATHGRPTEENAHPHRDCTGQIVVVHNGIIENYLELKERLQKEGHKFVTETDTEIVAHLVEQNSQDGAPLEEAVRRSLKELRGIYALVFLSAKDPQKIVAARLGPPSVVGLGDHEYFVASDIPALLEHTRKIFFLADGDIAVLTKNGVRVMDHDGHPVERLPQHVAWDPIMAEKGGYKHFMQKEIFEQPRAVRDTLLGRISQDTGKVFLDEMELTEKQFREFQQVRIVACGTSWHAGLAGKFMIERLARLPVEVDYGSEFRYRDPIIDSNTLTVCISQSGETADTLAAQREAKLKRSPTLAICNVIGSMITREASGTIPTHAGPEIGRAAASCILSRPGPGKNQRRCGKKPHAGIPACPPQDGNHSASGRIRFLRKSCAPILPQYRLPLSGPWYPLPHRARRCSEAQGDFLHSCGGLSCRRNEARAERAH